mmetsp:Transcript_16886/g.25228  ORF Transcript_16886/g.25228 Transcript_16886/m.25228 type:complete len:228 (+) Transcript_16886:20-703(+)
MNFLNFSIFLFFLFCCGCMCQSKVKEEETPTPPIWPFEFNATLAKVQPFNQTIQWAKLYYDVAHNRSRFDFFTNYITPYTDQVETYYIIYFLDTSIWFYYPLDDECYLRASNIPSVSPYWLQSFKFKSTLLFRGVYAQHWVLPEDPFLQYFNRAEGPHRLGLRSTNQANDPGATDYYDIQLGPQKDELWNIPKLCLQNISIPTMTPQEARRWAIPDQHWPVWEPYRP